MKNVIRLRWTYVSAILSFFFLFGTSGAHAQASFNLSKSADFSSEDRSYDLVDTLYMRVSAPHVDFADVDENEFRLKPAHGGNDIYGSFTNNFDGTYSAILSLENIDNTVSDWEWRAEIEDESGQEFEARVSLLIGTPSSGGGDSGGDDDDGDGDDDDGDDDDDADEIEITGAVEETGADFIVVAGTFFAVDDSTVVLDDNGSSIDFSSIMTGILVEIRGEIGADSTLHATRIKIEDESDDEIEITGTIEELGPDFITVSGLLFSVNDSTLVFDENKDPISFSELVIGMLVEIEAESGGGGAPVAIKIEVEDQIEDEVEITGIIEDITSDTITVLGQTFHVPGTVLVLDDDGNTVDFSSLTVGQRVEIKGEMQPGGDLVALRIKIEDNSSPALRVVAPIQEVVGASFNLIGINVSVDDNTDISSLESTNLTRFDLAVGQTVEIDAAMLSDGNLIATRINIQSVTIISGPVAMINSDEVTVEGVTFSIDANTIVLSPDNQIIANSEIMQAAYVQVRGVDGTNGYRATKVNIKSRALAAASESPESSIPNSFQLFSNYPNPFNPTTTISFELTGTGNGALVHLTIYDVLGRKVKTLISGSQLSTGTHQITWNATNDAGASVSSGLYLYRLRAAGNVETKTMTLLK